MEERGKDGLRPIGGTFKNLIPPPSFAPASNPMRAVEVPKENYSIGLVASVAGLHRCNICEDAGFVHPLNPVTGRPDYSRVVPCSCQKAVLEQQRRQYLLRFCELPTGPECQAMTFENFIVSPELQEAYDSALALAEDRAPRNWLTLLSDCDRGKTHLAIAVCRRWLARGLAARYVHVPMLMDELRLGFRDVNDNTYQARFDRILKMPLLVLDDLGTENRTAWVQEKLEMIIDNRLMQGLALMVTTNLTMERLPFRIASRLQRHGRVVVIDGPEYSEVRHDY